MSRCLNDQELVALLTKLASPEQESVWLRHLDGCSTCVGRLQQLKSISPSSEDETQGFEPSTDGPESPAGGRDLPLDAGASLPAGDSIAGYRIIKEVHRGGQGIVYQAIQQSTKRKVALKVMLEGPFAGPGSRRRFEREIELVASLRHPGIVPVFDSGMAQGRFYYAMEYIHGRPLAEWVSERRLSVDDTLRLFRRVCEAVDYAHQRGVIHRDLKPSNILVDDQGDPRIVDFGLAKIAGADVPDGQSLISVTGQLMGTLAYMSPEQAGGRPDQVDMRSDVYSLGVVLYRILTGEYPYDVAGQVLEVLTHIRNSEPARLHGRCRDINDEVETIVLKALSKEKDRRYPTAGALGQDIERYLNGEPIDAKRDSLAYVIRKHLRRYRFPVAVAAAFLLLLAAGLLTSVTFWRQAVVQRDRARHETQRALDAHRRTDQQRRLAEQQRQLAQQQKTLAEASQNRAEREAMKALSMSEFLQQMLASAQPGREGGGREVKVVEVLDRAAAQIGESLSRQPELELVARLTLGQTYQALGLYEPSLESFRRAHLLARSLRGEDSEEALEAAGRIAWVLMERGHWPAAEPAARRTMLAARRALSPTAMVTQRATNTLALTLSHLGRHREAERLQRELLDVLRGLPPEQQSVSISAALNNLGITLKNQGRFEEAETLLRDAVRLAGRKDESRVTDVSGRQQQNLGLTLEAQDKLAEAEAAYRDALARQRRWLGDTHPYTLYSLDILAHLLARVGRYDEAHSLWQERLERSRAVHRGDHMGVVACLLEAGRLAALTGRTAEAADAFADAVDMRRRMGGESDSMAQEYWRAYVIWSGVGDASGWASRALRANLIELLDTALVAEPTATFSFDEPQWARLQVRCARWPGHGEAQGDVQPAFDAYSLEQLRALPDPAPGVYLVAVELPRAGRGPTRAACWVLVAPWKVRLYRTAFSPEQAEERWRLLVKRAPGEERKEFSLARRRWVDGGFGPLGRLENFGLAAEASLDLPAGAYRFLAHSDDGVRLWVDGVMALRGWEPGSTTLISRELSLAAGPHRLRLEYFQAGGPGRLWVRSEPVHPQAAAWFDAAVGGDAAAIRRRALDQARIFEANRQWISAAMAYRQAIQLGASLPDLDAFEKTHAMQGLGWALSQSGQFADALAVYRESLSIREHLKGPDHPNALFTVMDLARTLEAAGGTVHLDEAVGLRRRILEVRLSRSGDADPASWKSMIDLLVVLRKAGKTADAAGLRERLLVLLRRDAAGGSEAAAGRTHRAAHLLERTGDWPAVEEAFRIAYEASRSAWGKDAFETTHRLHGMGNAQRRQSKRADAEATYRLSMEIRARALGEHDPEATWSMRELAGVLLDAARVEESLALRRQALKICREAWGDDHDETNAARLELSSTLTAAGQVAEAEQTCRTALESWLRMRGASHALTLRACRQDARLLMTLNRLAEAEKTLQQACDALQADGEEAGLAELAEDFERLYTLWSRPDKAQEWRRRASASRPSP